jgi:hypothetical protein
VHILGLDVLRSNSSHPLAGRRAHKSWTHLSYRQFGEGVFVHFAR